MKIAILYGNMQRGGAQRVMSALADYMSRQGDDVTLLTLDRGESDYTLAEGVKIHGLDVAGDSRNKLDSAKRIGRTLSAMRAWIKTERPQAILSFSARLTAELSLSCLALGGRPAFIASERANPAFENKTLLTKLERRISARSEGFIFQTERIKEQFPQRLRDIGAVIHNGLFSADIPDTVPDFDSRRHKEICAVGRMDNDQKAYDIMLTAFKLFLDTFQDYVLNIYGMGKDYPLIKAQIEELGIGQRVILHGNHPHVVKEIQDQGIFLMTSRFEGMPNALIEAMACGLPCVSTDCDYGPAELIEDGESGLLVPVDDVEAIAGALVRIASDRELARKLSCGAAGIRSSHSGDEICRQYRDYILKVIKDNE